MITVILWQVYKQTESFSSGTLTATDASGTPVATDASGNQIMLDLPALWKALSPFRLQDASGSQVLARSTESTPSVTQPSDSSAQQTEEITKRIASTVATQIKDQLLAKRATDSPLDMMTPSRYAPCDLDSGLSDATAQGTELQAARPALQPDMSQYIRKDSIPCWGCTLPQ